MMNIILSFIIAGIFLQTAVTADPAQNVSKIERFLYDRCRVHSTQASAYDAVKQHLSQFLDYLKYTASLLPNGKEQFCHDEKPKLIQLMGELARDLKPCFPKKERYLPKFMYESFSEFLIFACEGKGIQEYFSTQGTDCRQAMKSKGAGAEVADCFSKLFTKFDDELEKDDLCRDMKRAKTCFGDSLARHCSDFKGYVMLNNRFFDAVRKPCNSAVTFGISSAVLMILALFSTKLI